MKQIARVKVLLDDNVPEYMVGIIRCGSVVSEDESGKIIEDHRDLIYNAEYHSIEELVDDVARRLGVSKSIVEVVD